MKSAPTILLLVLTLAGALACGSASFYRGKSLYEHAQYDEAVQYLEESQRQEPNNLSAKGLLCRFYRHLIIMWCRLRLDRKNRK